MGRAPSQERWVGIGRADGPDARAAGRRAAGDALADRDDAKLVIAFAADALDLTEVLAGIRERTGAAPLIGCSTAGEIATDGPGEAGVVVTACGGSGFEAATAAARDASGDLRAAGAAAAGCLGELSRDLEHRVLILLTDGLAGDQQEIVRGAYGVAGAAVPLVGGCAGDDMRMQSTHQFHGEHVLEDCVVGAALASDSPFGIGVCHGWARVGEPMLITDSHESRVLTIEDRPALDVYLESLRAPAEAWGDPDAFTRFASTHPLGMASRRGEEHVRFVAGADFEDRALNLIAEVPRGTLAWFMAGDGDSVLAATDRACADAIGGLGGRPPLGLLAFDCIARKGILGEQGIEREIQRIAEHGDGAPVAGFYTYGEIARTRGIAGFHNQTIVVLALG